MLTKIEKKLLDMLLICLRDGRRLTKDQIAMMVIELEDIGLVKLEDAPVKYIVRKKPRMITWRRTNAHPSRQ